MGFRTKLIISYILIIALTLLVALALFSFVVQQTQQDERNKAELRLQRNAEIVLQILPPPNYNYQLNTYLQNIRNFAVLFDARFMLIDETRDVLLDTANNSDSLTRTKLPGYTLAPRDQSAYRGYLNLNGVNYVYFALPGPNISDSPSSADNTNNRISVPIILKTDLILAVPEAQLAFDWAAFLRGLALVTLVVVLISILAAYFIARNIARPLILMTHASEAIAQGDFNHRLEQAGKGEDEISRLAISFNRMAEEVSSSQQSVRDFVANVSHELKTPLTSIQGFSQAVLDGTVDTRPMLEHSLKVINEEAARMRRLVDELLDLSRIESGQIDYNWRGIDLKKTLERVLAKFEPLILKKGINLVSSIQDYAYQLPQKERLLPQDSMPGPMAWGDSDRLEQVFTNIVDNAIKYSPEGGEVKVELRLTGNETILNPATIAVTGNSYCWAQIKISNTGSLIPTDQLPRIFERFYKLDKSRSKKKGDSTGLGLAIAKELIDSHRGIVQVQSVPLTYAFNYPFPLTGSEGLTTFTIYLPLIALPLTTLPRPEPSAIYPEALK
ncbi:HAMP domain-containing sensor histidine kinase [Candidatus Chlorohelix sp.]|uniref:sensor histidine kinase n=1 Tax=Candidatus Chlorohelix sp. TaxID=3139201 RepID=UPI0030372CD8